jgi:polyisoprenoid-binding protein YceI
MDMTDATVRETPASTVPSKSPRKRHWWRWILASVVVIVVLVVVALGAFIKGQPTPSPLALPTAAASTPVGPLDGRWDVAAGTVAGFRVQESAVGMSNDTVGRTNAVTGTAAVSDNQVTSATFGIDLATIKVGGKTQPQFATSLDTQNHPSATLTLTQPISLSYAFTSGATITATATGRLTMNGASHPLTFTISDRRDGAVMQVAGSIPIAFSDWGIKEAKGYGFLGSLANRGVAEFLLVLHRQ